ncbi:MAG: ATP-binding protein [Saprospiraceae bacterium]|nr:ATP-binding protein [Saprospiraceae bacterium]
MQSKKILKDRYAKNSIIVTAQISRKNWYEYINEPTIADAILDRLTANQHRLELKGDSLRKNTSH